LINVCFFGLYCLFQVSAVVLFRCVEYDPFTTGLVLFALALMMEFLLIVQPPQLMKWIPFWNTAFGRGFVLVILSVMTTHGWFLIGLIALILSVVVMIAPMFTGRYGVPPPLMDYRKIFSPSETSETSETLPIFERIPG
jgi:hypothetical protein